MSTIFWTRAGWGARPEAPTKIADGGHGSDMVRSATKKHGSIGSRTYLIIPYGPQRVMRLLLDSHHENRDLERQLPQRCACRISSTGWPPRSPTSCACRSSSSRTRSFPKAEIEAAGYRAVWSGQKTYNGVAIVSRVRSPKCRQGIPGYADEAAARDHGDGGPGVRIVCAYVPNGQAVGSDKYEYKLGWLGAFTTWLREELARNPRLVVLGDYNIAPTSATCTTRKCGRGRCFFSEHRARGIPEARRPRPRRQLSLFEQPDARSRGGTTA